MRAQWVSSKSDCLEYVCLMVDYFNFVNGPSDEEGDDRTKDQRIISFCQEHNL